MIVKDVPDDVLREFIAIQLDEKMRFLPALGLVGAMTAGLGAMRDPSRDARPPSQHSMPSVTAGFKSTKLTGREEMPDTETGKPRREYSRAELVQMIRQAAEDEGIEPSFLEAIAYVESRYNPDIIYGRRLSSAGAQGMMQFMPDTAADEELDDPFDPPQAIRAAARLLRKLLERYDDDTTRAAAAYNAGPKNVDRYGGVPPFEETQNYVKAVNRRMSNSPLR